MARPLSAHEFDAAVVDRIDFDRAGLVVAERLGQVVGFAHAGFGPDRPDGPGQQLDRQMGTVAMLVLDPAGGDPEVAAELLRAAEAYLKARGAEVIYAGGRWPLDPFYRSIYGGSEWSGVLDNHAGFRHAVEAAGYVPAARSSHLTLLLADPEVRDPKAAILRRQVQLEVVEDAAPANWWEALGAHPGTLTRYRLVAKADGAEIARATTWAMAAFGRDEGLALVGLRAVEVAAGRRRQGFGRHLVHEVLRHARTQWAEVARVATDQANAPALGLYKSVGFRPIGAATLYRKPGP